MWVFFKANNELIIKDNLSIKSNAATEKKKKNKKKPLPNFRKDPSSYQTNLPSLILEFLNKGHMLIAVLP